MTELQDTLRLRESLFVARGRARNALRAQTDVTNYMLRRRIYETQRARNELDWQKFKVNNELQAGFCLFLLDLVSFIQVLYVNGSRGMLVHDSYSVLFEKYLIYKPTLTIRGPGFPKSE